MAWCLRASSYVRHNEGSSLKVHWQFRPCPYACDGLPMTVRGGGHPRAHMAVKPRRRMGPPPRSFAADAHDCIMVRLSLSRPDTSMRRDSSSHCKRRAPLVNRHPDHHKRAAVLGAVKVWPGDDGARGHVGATANLDSPCA